MLKNEKQPKRSLTERLKNVAENIHVDIFGYEKRITKNITQYLDKTAKEQSIPIAQLFVRIVNLHDTIRVYVHHKGRQLKEIPVKELAYFFAGEETASLPGIGEKIANNIKKYMDEKSTHYNITDGNLQIRIHLKGADEVRIDIFHFTWLLEDVEMKELIKYFKA
jgi:hypothetical protein